MIAANPFRCDLSRSKGLHVLLMKIDKTLDPCTIHSLAFQLKRFCFEFSMDLISTSSMRSMDYTSSPKLKRNSTPSLKFWTIPEKNTEYDIDNSHTNPQQLHIPRNRLPYILCRKTTGSFPSSKPVEIQNSSEFRKYPNTTSPWITS